MVSYLVARYEIQNTDSHVPTKSLTGDFDVRSATWAENGGTPHVLPWTDDSETHNNIWNTWTHGHSHVHNISYKDNPDVSEILKESNGIRDVGEDGHYEMSL